MIAELLPFAVRGAAWLATYAVHSSLLLGLVLLVAAVRPGLPDPITERLWKAGALVGILTATAASVTDLRPALGRLDVPPAVRAMHIVRETRTVLDGGERRVRREERVLAPAFPQPAHLAALGFGVVLLISAGRTAGFVVRRHRLRRRLRDRTPLAAETGGPELLAWLRRIAPADVRVSVSDALPGPAAIGRREICLPRRTLRELDIDGQRSILAHEWAHLLRRDPAWLRLLGWVDAVLFLQPLNRTALTRFQRAAEVLCDDWAVAATGRPIALARSLVHVASWVARTPPAPVPAMAEAGVPFLGRIERLVQARPTPPPRPHRLGIALAATLVAGLTLVAAPRVGAGEAADLASAAGSERRVVRILHIPHETSPPAPQEP